MKLKIPKTVKISTQTFKVEQDLKGYGGSFSFSEGKFVIGTKLLKDEPEHVFMIICHEVMEICTVIMKVRYRDTSVDENFKFFMDHKEFDILLEMFSVTISEFIK